MAKRMINTMRIAAAYNGGRRRDERGRYMEDSERMESRYDRGMTYGQSGGGYGGEMRRRNEMGNSGNGTEMGGEGYFVWDSMDPRHPPMESNNHEYWRQGDREEGNITDMREYGRRYSPQSHMDSTQHHRQMTQQRQIGFQHHQEMDGMHLTREKAREWVEGMKSPKWPRMEDIKMLAQKVGITGDQEMAEFWAVLNATYGDVYKVAKKYNVDRSDFYADLAKALFLEDEDAVEGKPMLYYEYLVQKDDD